MKWNLYITRNHKTRTHVVEVPGTSSMADSRQVMLLAAKHFGVDDDRILAIPTPRGMHGATTEAVLIPPAPPTLRSRYADAKRVVTGAEYGPFYIVDLKTGQAILGPYHKVDDADREWKRRFNNMRTHQVIDQRYLNDPAFDGPAAARSGQARRRFGNATTAPRYGLPKMNDIIYWIRSEGPGSKRDLVRVYFKGRLTRDSDEGRRGDVKARPTELGSGDYTAVYAPSDFLNATGEHIWPDC
jgi:hypothetical protein